MESRAKRTLVKSAPELWELADDPTRLETWMGRLLGSTEPVGVEVVSRESGRRLAWRSAGWPPVELELSLIERGLGTAVRVRASGEQALDETALERLIDELNTLEKRPFSAG